MAANCFIDSYEEISTIEIPRDRKEEVLRETREVTRQEMTPEYINKDFTKKEYDEAITSLQNEKTPGPNKLTNEMLMHLGKKASAALLSIFNNSFKTGKVPQVWRDVHMIPIHKQGKNPSRTDSYIPISLTSCCGKVMERMVNSRLMWRLEDNNLLPKKQAGLSRNHSTEDQATYIAQNIEDGFQAQK